MRLTITLDKRLDAYINEKALEWQCTKAMAVRTLIYDGVKANDARSANGDSERI